MQVVINQLKFNIMKNLFFISLILTFVFFSCTKSTEKSNDDNSVRSSEEIIKSFAKPSNLNSETSRIIDDITTPKYTVGVIDNPNYGKFSSTPEADIMISGKTPANISIQIDGDNYSPNSNGEWLLQSGDFKKYYGKNVNIVISDGDSSHSFNVYIPKQVLVKQLSATQSNTIQKTGNNLTWVPDGNSLSGKVALFYELYNNEDLGSNSGIYKRDILLLDDNGSYNIDGLIDNECKRIFFRMISGNTASTYFNDEKLLFFIASYDHHEYIVK